MWYKLHHCNFKKDVKRQKETEIKVYQHGCVKYIQYIRHMPGMDIHKVYGKKIVFKIVADVINEIEQICTVRCTVRQCT